MMAGEIFRIGWAAPFNILGALLEMFDFFVYYYLLPSQEA